MHVHVHYDAIFIDARVLYNVRSWYLSDHEVLSFLLHLICASYELEVYLNFELHHAIFAEMLVLYFCDLCGD